jgi:aldose 1-epimerase
MTILEALHPAIHHDAIEGFEAVTLAAGELEAAFVPSLGMVGASLRHAGEELLDRRGGLAAYRDTGTVMGLPFLHPWANRLAGDEYELHGRRVRLPAGPPRRSDEQGLPMHGLVAAHPGWTVLGLHADARAARLAARLHFAADPVLRDAFPFPHDVVTEVTLTPRALRLDTTVIPTGGAPVPIAFGYHPYLRLPGADRSRWELTLPPRRQLELDARKLPTGSSQPRAAERFALGDRGCDEGFDGIADGAAFTIEGGGRAIIVTHHAGYPVAQVFSPAGAQFVCLEPMTAPTNALRTAAGLRRAIPGRPFTAGFSIAVRGSG